MREKKVKQPQKKRIGILREREKKPVKWNINLKKNGVAKMEEKNVQSHF